MQPTLSRRGWFLPSSSAAGAVFRPRPILSQELHLLSRATFGVTPASSAEILTLGVDEWLERQLHPEQIDDSAFEALLPSFVAASATTGADIRLLARALFSKRQLAWRMVHFLNNHFSTYRVDTQGISESNEDDTFYKCCFLRFADALRESAMSPAMIDYLDSQVNVAASPNENYARELMELHTLGVGGGYTEPDVAEVARVFTGWARINVTTGTTVTNSYFRFRPTVHDTGPKAVSFGWSTPGFNGPAGVNEGLSFLAFLAAHPNTATRFTTKLCQYFVADQPPAGLLTRVRQVFVSSGGDLRATVRAIFTDVEFATTATSRTKVHDGFELVANVLRRFEIPNPNLTQLNSRVSFLRAQPHHNPVPTGYPEIGAAWQGPGNVLSRWDFADDLVHDRISGSSVPWATLFGATPPTSGAVWTNALCQRLCDSEVPATTILALTVFMDSRLVPLGTNPSWTQVRPHARALASIVLRLPEAQLH
jgi:uncharacterized protein (DUF1800 family)